MGQKKEFKKDYQNKLKQSQIELVKLQDWVIQSGRKIAIIFEGKGCCWERGDHKKAYREIKSSLL